MKVNKNHFAPEAAGNTKLNLSGKFQEAKKCEDYAKKCGDYARKLCD